MLINMKSIILTPERIPTLLSTYQLHSSVYIWDHSSNCFLISRCKPSSLAGPTIPVLVKEDVSRYGVPSHAKMIKSAISNSIQNVVYGFVNKRSHILIGSSNSSTSCSHFYQGSVRVLYVDYTRSL